MIGPDKEDIEIDIDADKITDLLEVKELKKEKKEYFSPWRKSENHKILRDIKRIVSNWFSKCIPLENCAM